MNKKNVSNPFINLKFLESLEDSLFLFVKFTYLFQNIYCRESHLIQYHQLQNIIVSQKKKRKIKRYEKSRATKKRMKRIGEEGTTSRGSIDVSTRGYTSSVHHGGFLPFVRRCIHNATTIATTGREKACSCWLCTRWFV